MKSLEKLINSLVVGLVITVGSFSTANRAEAKTIYIPQDFPTIQAGVDASTDGDIVRVSPGTYDEYVSISNKSITLQGSGAQNTIIMPSKQKVPAAWESCIGIINSYSTIDDPAAFQKIEGFTIKPGFIPYTIGIPEVCLSVIGINVYANASAEICNNVFEKLGTGVESIRGTANIHNNVMDNNSTGIFIEYNTFPVSIRDNLIINNNNCGIRNFYGQDVTITNNTVVKNGIDRGSYGHSIGGVWANVTTTINNNIISSNIEGGISYLNLDNVQCNDIFGNKSDYMTGDLRGGPLNPQPPNPKDISVDPLFCNPSDGNYQLSENSPCTNNTSCSLIGAFDKGCGSTDVKKTTWGQLKARYR